MFIKASTALRNNYLEISRLAHQTNEPIYITRNGEGDLVLMSMDAFEKREEELELEKQLWKAGNSYLHSEKNYSVEELDEAMLRVAEEVGHVKKKI